MDKRISEILAVFFFGFALLLTHYRAQMFAENQSGLQTVKMDRSQIASVVPVITGQEFARKVR